MLRSYDCALVEKRLQRVSLRMKNRTQAKACAPYHQRREKAQKQTHFMPEIAAPFPIRKPSAREEEPRARDETKVARAVQRLRMRDRGPHRCHARGVGFAPQRTIPDAIGHPENRRRFAKMMRQMTRAHAVF